MFIFAHFPFSISTLSGVRCWWSFFPLFRSFFNCGSIPFFTKWAFFYSSNEWNHLSAKFTTCAHHIELDVYYILYNVHISNVGYVWYPRCQKIRRKRKQNKQIKNENAGKKEREPRWEFGIIQCGEYHKSNLSRTRWFFWSEVNFSIIVPKLI